MDSVLAILDTHHADLLRLVNDEGYTYSNAMGSLKAHLRESLATTRLTLQAVAAANSLISRPEPAPKDSPGKGPKGPSTPKAGAKKKEVKIAADDELHGFAAGSMLDGFKRMKGGNSANPTKCSFPACGPGTVCGRSHVDK